MKDTIIENHKHTSFPTEKDSNFSKKQQSEIQELRQYLKKNQGKIHFPKKYFLSLECSIKQVIAENPSITAKDLLIQILQGVADNPTPEHLLKIGEMTLKIWMEKASVATV